MSDLLVPGNLVEPKQPGPKPRSRRRRVLSATAGVVALCAVILINVPTVGADWCTTIPAFAAVICSSSPARRVR